MKFIPREISKEINSSLKAFSAVILTGPRRSGKTFLLKRMFPKAGYYLLEDPDLLSRVRSDPRSWLDEIKLPAIVDEIQNAPELIPYIRTKVDAKPTKKGQWIITGSQHFQLMRGVTESMAGRAAVFELLPFSFKELKSFDLLNGGFPEVVLSPKNKRIWFSSYIQTYFERDVRSIKAVKDITSFRRFLSLLASRHGQILNKTDLAAPLGVSVPTITEWLSVLETTGHIMFVPPYFRNFGKRLIKSPKLYLLDPGLVCHLLGIKNQKDLKASPFFGAILEGFIASEIIKSQINEGRTKELYFFRDEQGLEVDFLTRDKNGKLIILEVKASKTVHPESAKSLMKILSASKIKDAKAILVHLESKDGPKMQTMLPGIKAVSIKDFLTQFPI